MFKIEKLVDLVTWMAKFPNGADFQVRISPVYTNIIIMDLRVMLNNQYQCACQRAINITDIERSVVDLVAYNLSIAADKVEQMIQNHTQTDIDMLKGG